MQSNQLQSVAAERVRDMRREAATRSLARRTRFTRPSRRTRAVASHRIGRLVRRTVHP
jgi:hypothetical protein